MPILKAGVCRDERGFTMVELGMVVLVLGMVMALTMPRFGGVFERYEAHRTVNVIRGTVRYLHAQAAFKKRIYYLVFDLERQSMVVCSKGQEQDSPCIREYSRELREYVLPATVHILDVVDPQGHKISEGEAVTRFFPVGFADPSIIHLGTDSGRKITLAVEPFSGRVKDWDGYLDPRPG
jgi:type II secretory pathway pseudopilin PulG